MTDSLTETLAATADAVAAYMDRAITDAGTASARLAGAMRHAALGGGKRLRPFLVVESAALFGVPRAERHARRRRAGMRALLFAGP